MLMGIHLAANKYIMDWHLIMLLPLAVLQTVIVIFFWRRGGNMDEIIRIKAICK